MANLQRAIAKPPVFKLSAGLTSKIASIIVHADEMMSPDGRSVDKSELQQRLKDPEVTAWLKSLGPLAPLKRQ